MSRRRNEPLPEISVEQLEKELSREKYRKRYAAALRSTVCAIALFLAAVLAVALIFPVLRIQSMSMSPTLESGDVVAVVRGDGWEKGDFVAFNFGGKLLVRRVIAEAGDVVNKTMFGAITVNGAAVTENTGAENAMGEWDIELPYTVPTGSVFVIGDNRKNSVDSGHKALGCVSTEQIIGRAALRVWPLEDIGLLPEDQ